MSAFVDSASVFRSRAEKYGMTAGTLDSLRDNKDVDTLGKVTFCSSYKLGQNDDAALMLVLKEAISAEPTPGDANAWRRLHFEASTMMMAELKQSLERHEDTPAKKIPQPERAARYNKQVARLQGMRLVDEYECSHTLVDSVYQQLEEDCLKYLSPEQCSKRNQELCVSSKRAGLVQDVSGLLRAMTQDIAPVADVSTEMRVRSAFTRRSLAYDQVGLFRFETLEVWVDFLFAQVMRSPPPGFQHVSMHQILQADRTLFLVLASLTREGIAPRPNGDIPLELKFMEARTDPQVAALLQPLPGSSSSGSHSTAAHVPGTASAPGQGKKKLRQLARQEAFEASKRARPEDNRQSKGSSKGKGKSKGDGRSAGGNLPTELAGGVKVDDQGRSICFRYNTAAGCSSGSSCKHRHVCCKPACFANHPFVRHSVQ